MLALALFAALLAAADLPYPALNDEPRGEPLLRAFSLFPDGSVATPQEETGVPLIPFAGLEGGPIYGLIPEGWGLEDERASGWTGSFLMGGQHWDGLFDIHLRFTYRHWDSLEIDVAGTADIETDAEARVRGALALLSVDRGFGMLRVGATIGGGLYLLKHRFERDVAPCAEGGLYVRLQPFPVFYLEVGALASGIRSDFNRGSHHTEVLYAGYGTAAFIVRF